MADSERHGIMQNRLPSVSARIGVAQDRLYAGLAEREGDDDFGSWWIFDTVRPQDANSWVTTFKELGDLEVEQHNAYDGTGRVGV